MATPPMPDVIPSTTSPSGVADGETPPTPIPFPTPFKSVRTGAWLLNYQPTNSPFVAYDGTIRVEAIQNGRRASGDLYQRPTRRIPLPSPPGNSITILLPPPNPANGIPIQAISKYRYYLRVTKILETLTFGNSFDLGLQMYLFNRANNTWAPTPVNCTATMSWLTAPAGYPSAANYLEGDLKNDSNGVSMGRLKMGWLSEFYRKVTVEIDTVAGSERPLDSGTGENWQTMSTALGYDLTLDLSDQNVVEESGESWSDAELNKAMLARRDSANLDAEWRYHILAVKQLDTTPRGLMYDVGATDSDNIPREGLGISTHWTIPSGWGNSSGQRFGLAKAAHFRTAVHEWGHALGLQHNTIDFGFMNTSDVISRAGTAANPFPNNIKWAFADNDQKRLRHWPDIFIRPGGVPFGYEDDFMPAITPDDQALTLEIPELQLDVKPLLTEVPLGVPVRVQLTLTNNGQAPVPVPKDISLKSACVRGMVTDASGTSRSFKPLLGCVDDSATVDLDAGESVTSYMTLLRGGEGALFPTSGVNEIAVSLRWAISSVGEAGPLPEAVVEAKTTVFVTGVQSAAHAKVAHRVLTSKDAHLVLAFGGAYLNEGAKTVQMAADDKVVGPHWGSVHAKVLGKAGRKEEARKVLKKMGDEVVMSVQEEEKLGKLLK